MPTRKRKIGDFGEKLAQNYLKSKGYSILDTNFSYSKFGEIDIIARDKAGQIVFIEVKTRFSGSETAPEAIIDDSKKGKMRQTAQNFLYQQNIHTDNIRFDCIAIELERSNKLAKIRHIKSIA